MTGPPLLVRVKKAAKQNEKGKNNTSTRSKETPLPPRVQEKGLREVPRESKKRPGPRMAPRQNTRRKGRTAKTGEQKNAAGDKDKKKEKEHKVRVGVCPITT